MQTRSLQKAVAAACLVIEVSWMSRCRGQGTHGLVMHAVQLINLDCEDPKPQNIANLHTSPCVLYSLDKWVGLGPPRKVCLTVAHCIMHLHHAALQDLCLLHRPAFCARRGCNCWEAWHPVGPQPALGWALGAQELVCASVCAAPSRFDYSRRCHCKCHCKFSLGEHYLRVCHYDFS